MGLASASPGVTRTAARPSPGPTRVGPVLSGWPGPSTSTPCFLPQSLGPPLPALRTPKSGKEASRLGRWKRDFIQAGMSQTRGGRNTGGQDMGTHPHGWPDTPRRCDEGAHHGEGCHSPLSWEEPSPTGRRGRKGASGKGLVLQRFSWLKPRGTVPAGWPLRRVWGPLFLERLPVPPLVSPWQVRPPGQKTQVKRSKLKGAASEQGGGSGPPPPPHQVLSEGRGVSL